MPFVPFLIRAAVTAVSLAVAAYLLEGISFVPLQLGLGDLNGPATVFINAVALGLLNGIVKPILVLLSLPITCLTLGLFIVVINGIMLLLLGILPLGFHVTDIFSAIIGGLVVSAVSLVLHLAIR